MKLARVGSKADELPLRVIRVNSKLFHVLRSLLGLRRHVQKHRLKRGARVGAEETSGRERGEAARGLLNAKARLRCDETSLLQGRAQV